MLFSSFYPSWLYSGNLKSAVEAPILDRLGHVGDADGRLTGKVRDGAGELQHAVVGARGEVKLGDRLLQQRARLVLDGAEPLDVAGAEPGVVLALAFELPSARAFDALPDLRGAFASAHLHDLVFAQRGHLDLDIDPIQQRSREPAAVARDLVGRAAAPAAEMSQIPARTGIHCADQLEARRIFGLAGGARDGDAAGFERLAQRFEHPAVELRQLVQKQHAVVREGYFAGARVASSADQRD